MDPIFKKLSELQLQLIEDQLSNNESSTDEELFEFFIEEGIPVTQARQACAYRDQYLTGFFQDGHTPILKGSEARRYDPYARRFRPT